MSTSSLVGPLSNTVISSRVVPTTVTSERSEKVTTSLSNYGYFGDFLDFDNDDVDDQIVSNKRN